MSEFDGIVEMFPGDVVFEASFGTEPCGERAIGCEASRALAAKIFARVPDLHFVELRHYVTPVGGKPYESHLIDVLTLRDGKISAKRSYRKGNV